MKGKREEGESETGSIPSTRSRTLPRKEKAAGKTLYLVENPAFCSSQGRRASGEAEEGEEENRYKSRASWPFTTKGPEKGSK